MSQNKFPYAQYLSYKNIRKFYSEFENLCSNPIMDSMYSSDYFDYFNFINGKKHQRIISPCMYDKEILIQYEGNFALYSATPHQNTVVHELIYQIDKYFHLVFQPVISTDDTSPLCFSGSTVSYGNNERAMNFMNENSEFENFDLFETTSKTMGLSNPMIQ